MEANNDVLKIRLPSDLKRRLKKTAAADPETDSLSAWVRRELRAGVLISKSRREREKDV